MTRQEKQEWNRMYTQLYKGEGLTREEERRFRELGEIQYQRPEIEDEEES